MPLLHLGELTIKASQGDKVIQYFIELYPNGQGYNTGASSGYGVVFLQKLKLVQ